MNNVVMVETPLQLLNAVEAIHSLGLRDVRLVIILSEPFPEEVFRPLLVFAEWKTVECLPIAHKFNQFRLPFVGKAVSGRVNEYAKEFGQLVKRQRFERLARGFGKVDNLVLGSYLAGYMRHLGKTLAPRKLYIVDDGTDTLRVNAMRRENVVSGARPQLSWWRKAKNIFRKAFVDWEISQADSVIFFSSYDLEVMERDFLIRNGYSFFRSRIIPSAVRDEVYFLGQPLTEDGYLRREEYLDHVSRIVGYYEGRSLVYVTHKRESPQMIEAVHSRGIAVRTFSFPIEVQLLQDGVPLELASFFCSALDNCRMIFGDSLAIKAFRIDQSRFGPGCEFVQDIYDYFRQKTGPKFEIVPL